MSRIALGVLALAGSAVIAACGDDDDADIFDQPTEAEEMATATEEPTATPTEDPTAEPTAAGGVFGPDDCPIDDDDFCAVAIQVANALVAGDEETISLFSAEQEIDCDEVAVEVFPECTPGEVLTGFVSSAAQGENIVRALGDYNSFVATLVDSVDADASDAEGSGEMQVLVVGGRGERYDMLATAILNVEDPDFVQNAGEQRWYFLLSFAQTEGGDWLTHAFVADTADGFAGAGFADPAADLLPAPEPWGSGG